MSLLPDGIRPQHRFLAVLHADDGGDTGRRVVEQNEPNAATIFFISIDEALHTLLALDVAFAVWGELVTHHISQYPFESFL